jgi:hypothetical protein
MIKNWIVKNKESKKTFKCMYNIEIKGYRGIERGRDSKT